MRKTLLFVISLLMPLLATAADKILDPSLKITYDSVKSNKILYVSSIINNINSRAYYVASNQSTELSGDITIPNTFRIRRESSLELISVSGLLPYSFQNCKSISSVTLGDIKSIGKFSFKNSSISSLTVNSVNTIADSAFYGCNNLT